jgi:hypothetical protein
VADGKWVTVPANKTLSGRAERRWMQPSGELMTNEPGLFGGFVPTRINQAVQQLGYLGSQIEQGVNRASGYQPRGVQLGRYASGDEQAAFKSDVPPPPNTQPPTGNPPPVLSDDADARASEARRMLQQATPFWEREENKGLLQAAQVGGGPRAGEAGYAQRADIAAWIEANKNAPKGIDGKNIVDRFLEKQRSQGLLDTPSQASPLVGERIAMPADANSAAQAAQRGLVGFEGSALEQAQGDVTAIQERERSAMNEKIWQAAATGELQSPITEANLASAPQWAQTGQAALNPAAYSGMEIARPFTDPEFNRQYAALTQPVGAQSVATREEPADPADALARRHLQRAAMIGN